MLKSVRFVSLLSLLLTGLLGAAITPASPLTIPVSNEAGAIVEEVTLYNQSYALVVGIDDYQKGWLKLKNAVKDARAVAEVMTAKGFEVTLLENPTGKELDRAIQEFFILRGEDPEARLFMWFAGHGHTENDEGFIIPADGLTPEAGARFRLSAIPLRNINTYVRLAQSKHVYAVFDSCFAGTIFDSQRAAPTPVITKAVSKPVRQFLTSGDAYQSVSDDGSFRELFIRAITGDEQADLNGDGFLAASELGLYLSNRVTNLTEGRQTPRYGKLRDKDYDRGDFIFALPQGGTPSPPSGENVAQSGQRQVELAYWNTIKDSPDPRAYQEYLTQFPDGAFSAIARRRMEDLAKAESDEIAALQRSNQPVTGALSGAQSCDASSAARRSPIDGILKATENLDEKAYLSYFMVDTGEDGPGLSEEEFRSLRKTVHKRFSPLDEMAVNDPEIVLESKSGTETGFRLSYLQRYLKKGKYWTRATTDAQVSVICDPASGRWMIAKITN